jgi:hypothetical protein
MTADLYCKCLFDGRFQLVAHAGEIAADYDQNLTLFALGWRERRFWLDSTGALKLWWKDAANRAAIEGGSCNGRS